MAGISAETADELTTCDCPECGGRIERTPTEAACADCGLVVDDAPLDRGPEWRVFDAHDERARARTGAPRTESRHDRGLSTEIGRKVDGHGRQLSGKKRSHMSRLRMHHSQAKASTTSDQNRLYAFTEIRRVVAALDLGDEVRDRACVLLRRAQHERLLTGRSLDVMSPAAVYTAAREAVRPVEPDDLVEHSRCEASDIRRGYMAFRREFDIEIPVRRPADYIRRFADDLALSVGDEHRARDLAASAWEAGIVSGRPPSSVAAACVYVAATGIKQTDVADALNATPKTIRRNAKLLETLD